MSENDSSSSPTIIITTGAPAVRSAPGRSLVGPAIVLIGVALAACNGEPEAEDLGTEEARFTRALTTLAAELNNPVGLVAAGDRLFWISQPTLDEDFRSDAILSVSRTADPRRERPARLVNPTGNDGIAITGLTADADRVYYTSMAAGGSGRATTVTAMGVDGSRTGVAGSATRSTGAGVTGGGVSGNGGAVTNITTESGVGRARVATIGAATSTPSTATCEIIDSGTLYHCRVPSRIVGSTTSSKSCLGIGSPVRTNHVLRSRPTFTVRLYRS